MEMGTDYYGLHNQVTQDDKWTRYHMGHCRQIDQIRAFPTHQGD